MAPEPLPTAPADPGESGRHLHAVTTDSAPDIDCDPLPHPEVDTTTPSRAVDALRTAFVPDSGLYRDRQPAIAEVVRRSRAGTQVPEAGPLRTASRSYGYLAAANRIGCQTWAWIVDHPARLAVVTMLLGLAMAWEPTRVAAGWALAPFSWAHTALT